MAAPALGAYAADYPAVPDWLNKGDNAWQLTAATLVGIQSMPGLVVLYGSIVKKKWAVNSAFMALYAYASSLLVWVLVGFRMAFGERLLPFWGKAGVALSQDYLIQRAKLSATANGGTPATEPFYPDPAMEVTGDHPRRRASPPPLTAAFPAARTPSPAPQMPHGSRPAGDHRRSIPTTGGPTATIASSSTSRFHPRPPAPPPRPRLEDMAVWPLAVERGRPSTCELPATSGERHHQRAGTSGGGEL